ncbi:hypothetical protein KBI31_01030 [Patescibacteria group bacterium]|nr:hypothetical protein [Patescibacteria group bacterium]
MPPRLIPGGKATEFQIRTPEMHEQAQCDVATHWSYKNMAVNDHLLM